METTLNIHVDIMAMITSAAGSRGISCSKMIVVLLQKTMRGRDKKVRLGRLVQYQDRCRKEDWHRFHIAWRPDDYEYFMDLKKLVKMSVSLLLALAVKQYITKLKKRDFTDKNRLRNYVVLGKCIDSVMCWKLFWGMPISITEQMRN